MLKLSPDEFYLLLEILGNEIKDMEQTVDKHLDTERLYTLKKICKKVQILKQKGSKMNDYLITHLMIEELASERAIETGDGLDDCYDHYIDLELEKITELHAILVKGKK